MLRRQVWWPVEAWIDVGGFSTAGNLWAFCGFAMQWHVAILESFNIRWTRYSGWSNVEGWPKPRLSGQAKSATSLHADTITSIIYFPSNENHRQTSLRSLFTYIWIRTKVQQRRPQPQSGSLNRVTSPLMSRSRWRSASSRNSCENLSMNSGVSAYHYNTWRSHQSLHRRGAPPHRIFVEHWHDDVQHFHRWSS